MEKNKFIIIFHWKVKKTGLLLRKNENTEIVKHCTGIFSQFLYCYFHDEVQFTALLN